MRDVCISGLRCSDERSRVNKLLLQALKSSPVVLVSHREQ